MKIKSLIVPAALLSLSLAGCNGDRDPSADTAPQRHVVSISALPIIQESIFALSPTFGGARNPEATRHICGLARGEMTQEQVDSFLKQQGLDPAKLPKEGNSLSLLVNGDKVGLTTACAAYVATTVLSPVDAREFMHHAVPRGGNQDSEAAKEEKAATLSPKQSAAAGGSTRAEGTDQPVLQIDAESLGVVLPLKLAEARTNADVFALIAAELQRRPGLTVDQYRELSKQLFSRLAPTYLERIKVQLPPANATFRMIEVSANRFAFSSSTGNVFEFGDDGLILRQSGVVWYGQGKLLGTEYKLQVAYFPENVSKVLESSSPGKGG